VTVQGPGRSGYPISTEAARHLLGRAKGRLSVRLDVALPVSQGFGTSAAGALATALSVAALLRRPRARATQTAHLADLFGGGGLGGVAAISGGGGLELRSSPGIPPFGAVTWRRYDASIAVGTVGRAIPTGALLADPRWRRRLAEGAALFRELAAERTEERFWTTSERFTDKMRLASPRLRAVLRALRRRGARAAQGMLGQSYFALLPTGTPGEELRRWAARARVPLREIRVGRRGAGPGEPQTTGAARVFSRARPRPHPR
jgi:pantoate kinase